MNHRKSAAVASLDNMAKTLGQIYSRFDSDPATRILLKSPENVRLDRSPEFFVHFAVERLEYDGAGRMRFEGNDPVRKQADWDELYEAGYVDELVAAVTLFICQPDERFKEWGIRRSWSVTDFRVLVIGTLSQILVALADRNSDQLRTAATDLEYMLDPDE